MKATSLDSSVASSPRAVLGLFSHGLIACVVALGVGMASANAATMSISFQDLDIGYSNVTDDIVDSDGPTQIGLVEFSLDGDAIGSVPSGIATAELLIPDLPAIPLTGGVFESAPGGSLNLDFGAGNFLQLELDVATVAYISASATVNFTFGGSVASIVGQDLPFGLELGDPVNMSFSTQIGDGTLMGDGMGNVASFTASGTGEVTGTAVPEPSSLGLLAIGGLLATMAASRYRLG